jgi:hypothetical protein
MPLIKLLGSAPNQVSTNRNFGTMAWQNADGVKLTGDAIINTLTVGLGSGSVATNTATGYQALNAVTTGTNTAYGYQALKSATTANGNTGIGQSSLANTTGNNNTGVGYQSGLLASSGVNNSYFGYNCGYNITTGGNNTFVGNGATANGSAITGSYNTGVGSQVLYALTGVGANNTAIGYQAGSTLTTGGNNILIGYQAAPSAITVNNEITIGNSSNTVIRYPHTYSTVASLPSASTVGRGSRTFVTDALTPTFQATVTGGGAVFTPIYSDGTNWKVG